MHGGILKGAKKSVRYLGPLLSWDGPTGPEITKRIFQATKAWFGYKSFWYVESSLRFKLFVFRAIVFATQGLQLSSSQELFAGGWIPSSSRRPGSCWEVALAKSCCRDADAEDAVAADASQRALAPSTVPHCHVLQVWVRGRGDLVHPWLEQTVEDLSHVAMPDGQGWVEGEAVPSPVQLVRDTDLAQRFLVIGVTQLRSAELRVCIPPPGASHNPQSTRQQRTHTATCSMMSVLACSMMTVQTTHTSQAPSATKCLSLASVERDFATGGLRTELHERIRADRDFLLAAVSYVATKRCPWRTAVPSIESCARQRVRKAFFSGHCAVDPASLGTELVSEGTFQCPKCGFSCSSVHQYNWHIRFHRSPPKEIWLDGSGPELRWEWNPGWGLEEAKREFYQQPGDHSSALDPHKALAFECAAMQQARFLKAIVMDPFRLPAGCDLIVKAKEATQAFATQAKTTHDKDRLGFPHIHIWNAFLTVLKLHAHDDTKAKLDEYTGSSRLAGPRRGGQKRASSQELRQAVRHRRDRDHQGLKPQCCLRDLEGLYQDHQGGERAAGDCPAGGSGAEAAGVAAQHRIVWPDGVAKASHLYESVSLMDFDTRKARCAAMGLHAAETKQDTAFRMVGKLLGATSC